MTRVVLVTTSFPESVSGREAAGGFVLDFARALANRAGVSVVAPGSEAGRDSVEGLAVRRYPVPMQPLSLLSPLNPAHWRAIVRTLKSGRRALSAELGERSADHVLALWALPSGYWARACARAYKVPYSVWALGSDIWSLGKIPLLRPVLRSVLRGATHRFADGFALAEDVRAISGKDCLFLASARKFPALPDAVERRGPPYRLAYLGRWHPNKGTDLLLEALCMLPEEVWRRIEAVRIAGGGPLEPQIRAGCEKLRRAGRPLELEGYMNPNEAAALFAWTDYVCIPSRIESIPVVFSDALQAGRPVIATPVGDLPRLLENGSAGVLADAATGSAYAAALRAAVGRDARDEGPRLDSLRRQFDVTSIADEFLGRLGNGGGRSNARARPNPPD